MGRRLAALLLTVVTVAAPAGCGGGPPEDAPVPAGLSATVAQFRLNLVRQELLVAVRNDSATPVRFRDVRLESPSFETLDATALDTVVPHTERLDLAVPYGHAVCPDGPVPEVQAVQAVAHIVLDGKIRRIRLPLPHPDPILTRIHREDCNSQVVSRAIDVGFTAATVKGDELTVEMTVTPRPGRTLPVTLTEVDGNAHHSVRVLSPAAPIAIPAGGGPVRVLLGLRPTRCDPHSFAEAKTSHLYSVQARVGDAEPHRLQFTSGGDIRKTIEAYMLANCGIS
ncbi:hypothetical protein GCM10022221_79990 [Actinocorallia aurea]